MKFKKFLSIFLITSLLLTYILPPVQIFAEENLEEQEQKTVIENSAEVDNTVETISNTGENTIGITPTLTPVPTQAPDDLLLNNQNNEIQEFSENKEKEDENINIENTVEVVNEIDSNSVSGENKIETKESEETKEADSQDLTLEDEKINENSVETGDAISQTEVENDVNTTEVNSKVVYQTINIHYEESGDIDLSAAGTIIENVLAEKPESPVINISVTSIDNFVYLSNDISSLANTGNNSITGQGESDISTGDAYSTVTLLNKVNLTVINSVIHIVTINIYGDITGDIILPDINPTIGCDTCGTSMLSTNSAVVENNLDSTAITGQNQIKADGEASIETGDALSKVNSVNLVNANYLGVNVQGLFINDFGNWEGDFVGWGEMDTDEFNSMIVTNSGPNGGLSCDSCVGDLYVKNDALVFNNVSSEANTGNNNITGDNAKIKTGNAFSAISVINLVNTNFFSSFGFFGFINIFGTLRGNIGGKSEIDALKNNDNQNNEKDSEKGENQVVTTSNQGNNKRDEGGILEVTQSNNSGEYVLPGDTVTFFVKIKNPGQGKVYGAKLNLFLIKDELDVGGALIDIGDIEIGQTVRVTTGLVLSDKTKGGIYTARAYVEGAIGDDQTVSSHADSEFYVFNPTQSVLTTYTQPKEKAVLGAGYPETKATKSNSWGIFLLIGVVISYITLRAIREKERFSYVFSKQISFKSRINAIRLFFF